MSDLVYVSGHRNPDTDSICSAIAYSYLLNATNKYNAVPVRLGEINRETEYVLKRFGVEHPVLLKTVKQKVEDLNYDKVTVFSKDLTLKTAWFLLKQQNLKIQNYAHRSLISKSQTDTKASVAVTSLPPKPSTKLNIFTLPKSQLAFVKTYYLNI